MNKSNYELVIDTETQAKDSNELFDYETKDTHNHNITTNKSGQLYRNKNMIEYSSGTYNQPWSKLLDINCTKTSFYINNYKNANSTLFEEAIWIITKYHTQKNEITSVLFC